MQREFIISWNRCEWITNQAFPKYVWLQNGAKVFRKSYFQFICKIKLLKCAATVLKIFLAYQTGPKMLLQNIFGPIVEWMYECTYLCSRPTLDPAYTLLDTNRISLFYFVLFQTSAILCSIIFHCHEIDEKVRFFLLMHTYMAHKTLFSRVILEICKKVVHRA